ncbi:hypothetical protein ACP4OV_009081 [Aristida adscensionis]
MDWAAGSGAPSWAAAADAGPTMVSFAAGPPSSAAPAEIQFQDFALDLAQRARPAGAGRRSRAAGAGAGAEACSVDGCRSDLSRCRDYHRRHKVCEAHSKTPVVVVGGQEQRFCQQCSRFHMLSEFDEGKRSCRKRLDGHNRRRRKPQHDVTNLRGFFPYYQVNQFEIYPQTVETAGQDSDTMHLAGCQLPFSISFSGTFKMAKRHPVSEDSGIMLTAPHPGHLVAEESSHARSSTLNGHSSMLDPECALSLLSSSLHRPSPSSISTSSHAHISASSQAAATTFASGGSHHVFAPDAAYEDPSQALLFPWQ